MKILSDGTYFVCHECGLNGLANLPGDYSLVICNDEKIYSITCPCCKKEQEIPADSIPDSLRKYIKPVKLDWYHE